MLRLAMAAVCAWMISACQIANVATANAGRLSSPAPSGWQPGEKIETFNSPTYGNVTYRFGTTSNGLTYKIYGDGTATITADASAISPDWRITCKSDAMNDKQDCDIESGRTSLLIDYKFSKTPQLVCIKGHDFPGRNAYIRIGKSTPIRTNEYGCLPASKIISSLLSSDSVSTRKVHWPYDYHVDETGPLRGLKEAVDLMAYIRPNS